MPRLKLKRKVRKLDFKKSLVRFLKDERRNFFIFERRLVGIRNGKNEARMIYNETGERASYKAVLVQATAV